MLIWGLLACIGIVCQNTVELWAVSSNPPKNLQDTLQVIRRWKYIDYDFDNEAARRAAIRSGAYNRSNIYPLDVDYWKGKFFVTTVRQRGVPSTLNVVSDKTGPGGPLLAPYPDWSWANAKDCSGITSVYRVAAADFYDSTVNLTVEKSTGCTFLIDRCDRLWVLDTGIDGVTRKCPAQLLVFDLNTTTLLKQITIPNKVAINSTTGLGLLVTPEVLTLDRDCNTTYVYIADTRGNALIIYDGSSFRHLTSHTFDYDPKTLPFTILGQSFVLPDGIGGMALSRATNNLYYSPSASFSLDYVNIRDLENLPNDQVQYREYRNILTAQPTPKAISKNGTLFFGLVSNTAIGCWNEFNELNRENIDLVAQNIVTLQVPSGLKIKDYNGEEVLLVVSNRYQKYATQTMNFTDDNFRILTGNVHDLINGTRCQPPRYP